MSRGFIITKDVEVEIQLDEIPTHALVEELRDRLGSDSPRLDYGTIIKVLKAEHCPEHILGPLIDWTNQPLVGETQLKQWRELCLVK